MKVLVDPDFRDLAFEARTFDPFFVDKTLLLEPVFGFLQRRQSYVCVTRPRRFGKSIAASMIASFFGSKDSSELFDRMLIAQHPDYHQFLNAFHVIYLDLIPDDPTAGVAGLLAGLKAVLQVQLKKAFPGVVASVEGNVLQFLRDINEQTGARFVFVVDEWDSILHDESLSEAQRKQYLSFFTALLKDQPYVMFAYLTGILPISMHSSGSDLNMFRDYTFISDETFDRFFGFTEAEVDRLFEVYQDSCSDPAISRDDLDLWYNGYTTASGARIYNPQSVVKALTKNELANYWGKSGPSIEVFHFVRLGVGAVRADIEALLVGGSVKTVVDEEFATRQELRSRKEILSALVVYGLLTADANPNNVSQRVLRIPNREILQKFVSNVEERAEFGGAHDRVLQSRLFKQALDEGRADEVARILQEIHTSVSPVRDYNRELELAHVLDWALLDLAVDVYDKQREAAVGNGFADFVLVPVGVGTTLPTYIIELKVGASPQVAIEQIKSRNYAQSFERMSRLKGEIVAVGISYDPADPSKTHSCEIEVLREAV